MNNLNLNNSFYYKQSNASRTLIERLCNDLSYFNQQQQQPSAISLFIRLINNTFLSLPIESCQKVEPLESIDSTKAYSYDACQIHWNKAKIFQNSIDLKNFIHNSSRITTISAHLKTSSNYNPPLEYMKSTYLTISSLLSLCGILVNIFIILTIIFNRRQKRNSTVRCNGNSNQNNSLLFQLTITGLILTAYVLIGNSGVFYTNELHDELESFKFNIEEVETRDENSLCRFFSALSTLLPPTPFDSNQLLCSKSNMKKTLFKGEEDSYGERIKNVALILKSKSENNNKIGQNLSNFSTSPSYYFKFNQNESEVKQVNLDEILETFFVVNIMPNEQLEAPSYSDNNSDGLTFFRLTDLNLVTLIINVIASVHIWTVASLAYDRYYAIANPLHYLRSHKNSRKRIFLILTWTLSIILNLLMPMSLRIINGFETTDNLQCNGSSLNHLLDPNSWSFDSEIGFELVDNVNGETKFYSKPSKSQCDLNLKLNFLTYYSNKSSMIQEKEDKKVEINFESFKMINLLNILSNELFTNIESEKLDKNRNESEILSKKIYISALLVFSLFCFVIIILIPLSIITICNIKIYKIVKAHQRRLSLSSVSVGTSQTANLLSHQQQQQQNSNRRLDLDRSETCSLASLLMSKFVKTNVPKYVESCQEENFVRCRDRCNNCSNKSSEDTESNITNRSRRLVARQDSYQKIINNQQQVDCSLDSKFCIQRRELCQFDGRVSSSCSSITTNHNNSPTNHHRNQRNHLKRKISDHSFVISMRKDSNTSQPDEYQFMNNRDLEREASFSNEHNSFDPLKYQSGSILHQLKMAGLSFAGISIQQEGKQLNKSTSCSLGSLNQAYIESSPLKNSMETLSSCPKRSYVALNSSMKYQDNSNSSINKYSTRILDSDTSEISQNGSAIHNFNHTHNNNSNNNNNRLPFTIGTKSAAFNVVIWLIITMLLLTLPHYLLVTVDQIMKLNLSKNDLGEENVQESDGMNNIFGLQVSSIWFSCLCRILFLSIIPLNGWLYGIRSRSLRATIRVVLKRYISRKQASIEIGQRQRSLLSFKSSQEYRQHSGSICSCHKASLKRNSSSGSLRRPTSLICSSSSQRRRPLINTLDRSLSVDGAPSLPKETDSPFGAHLQAAGIKFLIGDYTDAEEQGQNVINNSTYPQNSSNLPSSDTSQASSLTSSSRSLMSSHSGNCSLPETPKLNKITSEKNSSELNETLAAVNTNRKISVPLLANTEAKVVGFQCGSNKRYDLRGKFNERLFSSLDDEKQETPKQLNDCKVYTNKTFEFNDEITPEKNDPIEFSINCHSNDETKNAADYHYFRQQRRDPTSILNAIIATSARIFGKEPARKNSDTSCKSYDGSRFCSQEQCKVSLLRSNSDNNSNFIKPVRQIESRRKKRTKQTIQASKTLDNFSANCEENLYLKKCQCCQQFQLTNQPKQLEDTLRRDEPVTEQMSHLKPPNFLKLILDSNNCVESFATTSALSPIKECSSNHSYASSLSSLNVANNNQPASSHRNSSISSLGDLRSPTSDSQNEN